MQSSAAQQTEQGCCAAPLLLGDAMACLAALSFHLPTYVRTYEPNGTYEVVLVEEYVRVVRHARREGLRVFCFFATPTTSSLSLQLKKGEDEQEAIRW